MRVLVCKPGKQAYFAHIGKELADLQKVVGGHIEAVYPWEDPVALVCDEDSKINGKEPCRALYDGDGEIYDIVCGTFFICGIYRWGFSDIPKDLEDKYMDKFREPEVFAKVNGEIKAFKI